MDIRRITVIGGRGRDGWPGGLARLDLEMGRVVSIFVTHDPRIARAAELPEKPSLRGSPPVATCTICAGRCDIGWEHHVGVVRTLDVATTVPTY